MPKTSKESSDIAAAKQKLRKLFANPQFTSLRWNHAVGQLVVTIHPVTGKSFGASVIHKLAKQVQPHGSKNLPGHLLQTRKFATLYSKAAAEAIARRTDSKGRDLGWQRMACLLSEHDVKKRIAVLEQTLDNAWTVRRLREELQQRHGGKRSWGGRRPTVPKSVLVLLGEITKLCEQWEHWAEAMGLGNKDTEPVAAAKELAPRVSKQFAATLVNICILKAVLEQQAEQGGRK